MPPSGSTETLHRRILDDFRTKIVDGEWEPGRQLAKETELAADYGVARMTMNKVLTQLAQEGYLVRRKRSGTFVAKARVQSAVLEVNNIAEEVAALGRPYSWKLLSNELRRLTLSDLRLFGARTTTEEADALCLQGIHYAGDEPFCLETRAINPVVVPQATGMDFSREVPGNWLLASMPWTTARHQVRAVNAEGSDARLLRVPDGAACLEILRKTQVEAGWVTLARLLYPGESHQLVAELAPHAPPGQGRG
ncbi:UTRA domain-containing protein [Tropicimonas isoalkanivorans]|uniref:GntR family transcriptional regulator, histidine utilization repressor n=1 Tax=Tropicimonas isoalkanivorans TaxID=441112 RepID=A0A1I1HMZ3_9RHOB|nr:UTRA domain-containing protein [Tropicimonas isoalkanivorans]SFC22823.1 GntR family transcriptional regulator, histidine utilization repressor [Tropicimonas isoalkanivorans]